MSRDHRSFVAPLVDDNNQNRVEMYDFLRNQKGLLLNAGKCGKMSKEVGVIITHTHIRQHWQGCVTASAIYGMKLIIIA